MFRVISRNITVLLVSLGFLAVINEAVAQRTLPGMSMPAVRQPGTPLYAPAAPGVNNLPSTSPFGLSFNAPSPTSNVATFNSVYGSLGSLSPFGGAYGGNSGYGGGGYGGSYQYYEDPIAGYLRAAAALTTADGQYLSSVQQARQQRAKADAARLDIQRRARDEARAIKSNPDETRLNALQAAYERASHNPPLSEIVSGQSLNDLLHHEQFLHEQRKVQGQAMPDIPLESAVLRHINLAGERSPGSLTLLKNAGKWSWPMALLNAQSAKSRERLSLLAVQATDQLVSRKPISTELIKDMLVEQTSLQAQLLQSANEVSPSEYVQAKRFLGSLESTIRSLGDETSVKLFSEQWQNQIMDMHSLIDFMGREGLRFAPAGAGDEQAYLGLHRRLLMYNSANMQADAGEPNNKQAQRESS